MKHFLWVNSHVLGLVLLLFSACSVNTRQYEGDGKIISVGGDFISKGYEVVFNTYKLGELVDTVFYVKKLPNLNKHHHVVFRIDSICDTAMTILKNRHAKLSIVRSDSVDVTFVDTTLGAWRHSGGSDVIEYYGFYEAPHGLRFEYGFMKKHSFKVHFYIDTRNLPSCAKGEVKVVLKAGGFL